VVDAGAVPIWRLTSHPGASPSIALQWLKQEVSRRAAERSIGSFRKLRTGRKFAEGEDGGKEHFGSGGFIVSTFGVAKEIQGGKKKKKLELTMHGTTPVKAGVSEHPKDWPWSKLGTLNEMERTGVDPKWIRWMIGWAEKKPE